MSKMFKCVNCGFECEIIDSENLDIGIAECEKCGMKGLRRQGRKVSFVAAFTKVIAMVDPQANSLMSKDMPPAAKILADWSRKACDEIEQLQSQLTAAKKREANTLQHLLDCSHENERVRAQLAAANKQILDYEQTEAAVVCPEDVGIEEYVRSLLDKLAAEQEKNKRLRELLTNALPHIECETIAQSRLISAIGELLEADHE